MRLRLGLIRVFSASISVRHHVTRQFQLYHESRISEKWTIVVEILPQWCWRREEAFTAFTIAAIFKLAEAAEKSWRRLDGHNQLPKIILGVKFTDGIEVVRSQAQPAAA